MTTSAPPPMHFRWDGDHMVPLNPRAADRAYVVGATYRLEHREDRSSQTHAHYFACLQEAFNNLPDEAAQRIPSAEHLRKLALISTGYRDERTFVAGSKAEAIRLAAFLRPMDDYAVVSVSGNVVVVLTAKSQSMRAMDRKTFQESKTSVLEYVSGLIGATVSSLETTAREIA